MKLIYLTDSIQTPLTGIGRYTYELGTRLKNSSYIDDIMYFHQFGIIQELSQLLTDHKGFCVYTNKKIRQNSLLRKCLRPIFHHIKGRAFSNVYKEHQDYLVHTPSYLLPIMKGKSVSTVHDLSHIVFPECHPKERVEYLNKYLIKTLDHVDHVITVSNFSKNELIHYFKYDYEKITAIPLGISDQFKPYSEIESRVVLRSLGIQWNSYLLSVATFEPRKNLQRLIEAYVDLPKSLKNQYPLVLAGASGWLNKDLNIKIKTMLSTENIKILGYVTHEQLPYLYAGARGFAYPSLYEGFGFQVLEAMASGVPVLTSKNTSMDEISGGLPLLIDPFDVTSIKIGLETLLVDETWRENRSVKGINHVAQYTWEKCAKATIDVYKKVYETKI